LFAITGSVDKRLNRALNGFAVIALLLFGLFQLVRGIIQLGELN
jgi:hypothetical protein